MSNLLGRLAAAKTYFRRARVAGTAASFLTFALLTTGCSVLLEPTQGSRFLRALALLIQHLPEGAPIAIEEFVRTWLGENFAEKFNAAMAFITPRPVLTDGLWGRLFDGIAVIMFGVMLVYAFLYLRKMFRAIDEHGVEAVNEGRGGIVPPFQYLGRYLIVAFQVIAIPVFLQWVINFTWELVHDFSTAAYSDVGFSVGEVMFELLLKMVSGGGLGLITLAVMLIFIGAALLIFAGFYLWNYLMIFLRTIIAVFKAPRYLNADPNDLEALVEPGLDALESVAFLGSRWAVPGLTPFFLWWIVTDLLGDSDSPLIPIIISIGLFIFLVLGTAAPWIVFGFRLFGLRIWKGFSKPIPDLLKPKVEGLDKNHSKAEAAVVGLATGVAAAEAAKQGWLRRQLSRLVTVGDRLASQDPRYREDKARVKMAADGLRSGDAESIRKVWNKTPGKDRKSPTSDSYPGSEPPKGPDSGDSPRPPRPPNGSPAGPSSPRPRPHTPSQGGVETPSASKPKAQTQQKQPTGSDKAVGPRGKRPSSENGQNPAVSRTPDQQVESKAAPASSEKTESLPVFEKLLAELKSSKLPVAVLSDEELAVCAALRMEQYANSSDEELIAAAKQFLNAQSGAVRNNWHDIGTRLRALLP